MGKWSKLPVPKFLHLLDEDNNAYLAWFLWEWNKKIYKSPQCSRKLAQLIRATDKTATKPIVILQDGELWLLGIGVHGLNSISFAKFEWHLTSVFMRKVCINSSHFFNQYPGDVKEVTSVFKNYLN